MAAGFFAKSPVLALPVAALFVFLAAFLVITLRAFFTPKKEIERLANLPLETDEGKENSHV